MTSIIQNSSPVDVVKAFIACVRTKDVEHMRKMMHPKATACLIRENEPHFKPLAEAIDPLAKAEQELVEVSWDEVEHIDGEYATVWATWSMHWDGELHQLGSSSYSCWKSPLSGWIILTMSDVARPPNDTVRV
ncbi:uncharacterized protein BDZ99DRAFT_461962 [Mytilinidion resinicola]|uniref:DUF4440 domain-containing protein n=1 Tax=Mytilinidion resinicola TaxID=574789 RepID=A0A6A6YVK7_9PEZI|nr:uncharacterized protein BDZ99DRAFT_461962 [Mytilinidion resinicola]KAF2812015.1 hypothetical protein BDZ99DRAFT_461962 [Mytilinidion resinicola]